MSIRYKLHYFDARGRGEIVRLLFAAAGQKFEDNRIAGPNWPSTKPNTPFGGLPVLEVDGKQLAQTAVIVHYVANQHGLGGEDAWEQAQVDSVVQASLDIWGTFARLFRMPAGTQKDTEFKDAKDSYLPAQLGILEKFIAEHGTNGHAVGDKLTSADIAIFNTYDQLLGYGVPEESFAKAPHVKKVVETTQAYQNIAAYLKTRK